MTLNFIIIIIIIIIIVVVVVAVVVVVVVVVVIFQCVFIVTYSKSIKTQKKDVKYA